MAIRRRPIQQRHRADLGEYEQVFRSANDLQVIHRSVAAQSQDRNKSVKGQFNWNWQDFDLMIIILKREAKSLPQTSITHYGRQVQILCR